MAIFRKKITVDACAALFAEAIEEDVEVYKSALRDSLGDDILEERVDDLTAELWVYDLFVLDMVLSTIDPKQFVRGPGRRIVSMLVVGYLPVAREFKKDFYVTRSNEYGAMMEKCNRYEQMLPSVVQGFLIKQGLLSESMQLQDTPNSVERAFGMATLGSFQGLESIAKELRADYKVMS